MRIINNKTPSAGKLELADTCPASFAIPHIGERSEPMDLGKAKHEFMEVAAIIGQPEALDALSEDAEIRAWCEAIDVDRIITRSLPFEWDIESIEVESRFIVDWRTGDARAVDEFPTYEEDDGMRCVIDLIGHDGDDLGAADYKTGRQQPFFLKGPEEHLQVRGYGRALTSALKKERVQVAITHIDEDGKVRVQPAEMWAMELDGFNAQLRNIMNRVIKARHQLENDELPKFVVGDHCARCPAVNACPANAGRAIALVENRDPIVARLLKGEQLTGEEKLLAYSGYKALDGILEKVKKALTRLVDADGPFPDGEGKEIYIQERRTERIDPFSFMDELENQGKEPRKYGDALTVSKTKIESVLGKDDGKAMIKQLRETGGIKTGYPARFLAKRKERKKDGGSKTNE